MAKPKLGRGLAALTGTAILATKEAATVDETGAAMRIEQARHERAVLDTPPGEAPRPIYAAIRDLESCLRRRVASKTGA